MQHLLFMFWWRLLTHTCFFFLLLQRFLCVLRAVSHHCVRYSSEPEHVTGVHICGDDGVAGLRNGVSCARQRHHRHDPRQYVRRHVAMEHQPQRSISGEPGHGETPKTLKNTTKKPTIFFPVTLRKRLSCIYPTRLCSDAFAIFLTR